MQFYDREKVSLHRAWAVGSVPEVQAWNEDGVKLSFFNFLFGMMMVRYAAG